MQALWKAAGRWGAVRPRCPLVQLLSLFIAVAGCALRDSPLLGDMDTSSALRVIEQPLVLRHLLTGELFAREAVELLAPNVGQWPIQIRQLVENGVLVERGDAVVEFDNSTLVGNLDQQRTAVVTAETQLVSTQATSQASVQEAGFELSKRKTELDKASLLADIPEDLKSERDYDRLQLDKRRAELELREAAANLETKRRAAAAEMEIQRIAVRKARYKVDQVEHDLERLSLRAPRAGVVQIGRNDDQDRVLQAGDSVFPGNTVASIPDLETLAVKARLFDVDDLKIETGLRAIITLDAYPELEYEATVKEVQQLAQQVSRRSLRRSFDVLLELAELDLRRMKPGMSVKVAVERVIQDASGNPPVVAPREGLDLTALETPRAGLANGDWRDVRLGACSATHCVIEEGLEPGELLRRISTLGVMSSLGTAAES